MIIPLSISPYHAYYTMSEAQNMQQAAATTHDAPNQVHATCRDTQTQQVCQAALCQKGIRHRILGIIRNKETMV